MLLVEVLTLRVLGMENVVPAGLMKIPVVACVGSTGGTETTTTTSVAVAVGGGARDTVVMGWTGGGWKSPSEASVGWGSAAKLVNVEMTVRSRVDVLVTVAPRVSCTGGSRFVPVSSERSWGFENDDICASGAWRLVYVRDRYPGTWLFGKEI